MKTQITSEEYINIYEACNWNPRIFSKALKALRYSDKLIVNGDLDLQDTPIKFLVNVKEVYGWVELGGTQIQSLGELEIVSQSLDLHNTPIESLGYLKYVGRNLHLKGTPLSKVYSGDDIMDKIEIGRYVFIE